MDYGLIKKIVSLVEKADIHELEIESEELRIKVNKSTPGVAVPVYTQEVAPAPQAIAGPVPAQAAPQAAEAAPAADEDDGLLTITAPMVGTFYRAASPDSAPFVKVGDPLDQETVVCILEAMKVMNEIKAELSGKVVEILVENAQPVEFGQPLFKIQAN